MKLFDLLTVFDEDKHVYVWRYVPDIWIYDCKISQIRLDASLSEEVERVRIKHTGDLDIKLVGRLRG